MTKITVAGAGMAGLLAGAMLRSDCNAVIEQQLSLPNNHSALLRFRSSVVGDVLGLEFKQVRVMKAVSPWRNPLADALAYSFKTNGSYTLRSSLTAKGEVEDRYIAPGDLIKKMADRVQAPIMLGEPCDFKIGSDIPVISTVPMPTLMKVLEYPKAEEVEFRYQHGANINFELPNSNAYGTIYVPDPEIPFSRISITGKKVTVEFSGFNLDRVKEGELSFAIKAVSMLGMHPSVLGGVTLETSEQKYAKILPIDESARKQFMIWATEKHNVYSLGRFATWRPGLLLDDVVNDVRVIRRLINAGHSYDHRKA